MTKVHYDIYNPDADISDADLENRIEYLSGLLVRYCDGTPYYSDLDIAATEAYLQCLMELRDRRTQDVDPPFMSSPGDWVLGACLVGIIWLIVKPYIGM